MNYKHAYHAGNHTEVFKHSVLVSLIEHLKKKDRAFTVLDTHAGAGIYDLQSEEARKTRESDEGIGRVFDKTAPAIRNYLQLVTNANGQGLRYYPGSPAIVAALLRSDDKLIACELRPDDFTRLRNQFVDDRRVAIHQRDGYQAIKAFIPPETKRGIVFIDPPFESADELSTLCENTQLGLKKWPTGIFAVWYPIKSISITRHLRERFRHLNVSSVCCEFMRQKIDDVSLAGSGMVVFNPPWMFEEKLRVMCEELQRLLSDDGGSYQISHWSTA